MDALGLGDSLDGHERDDAASATHGDSPARGSTDLMGVKRQIQQYCVAKERDDAILSEARAEIKVLRDRIVELQASKRSGTGGHTNAIVQNEKVLARHEELMERRLVKARENKMGAIARNNALRDKVNVLRREKVTIQMMQTGLQEDSTALTSNSVAVQERIGVLMSKCEELDAQTDGIYEESRVDLAGLESELTKLLEEEKREDARTTSLEMLSAQTSASSGTGSAAQGLALVEMVSKDPFGTAQMLSTSRRRGSKDLGGLGMTGLDRTARPGINTLPSPPPNPADRPMSRHLATLIAAGKQPSGEELRSSLHSKKGRSAASGLGALEEEASGRARGQQRKSGTGEVGHEYHPRPTGAAAALLMRNTSSPATHSSPGHSSKLLNQNRWQNAFSEAIRKSTSAQADLLREAFERAFAVTDCSSLEELVSKFQDTQKENEILYQRVTDMVRDGDEARAKLVQEWALSAARDERDAAEDGERLAVIYGAEHKLQAVRSRCVRVREENVKLNALADAARRGITRLLEILQGEMVAIEDAMDDPLISEPVGAVVSVDDVGATGDALLAHPPETQPMVKAPISDKQEQDIVRLYVRAETLVASVMAMYSRHVLGIKLPIALPTAVLADALAQQTSSITGHSSMSRMMSIGALPGHRGRDDHHLDAKHGVKTHLERTQESLMQEEVPATRGGLVTLTQSERRASLEMSMLDMRKGLLVEAARLPSGGRARTRSGKREGSSTSRSRMGDKQASATGSVVGGTAPPGSLVRSGSVRGMGTASSKTGGHLSSRPHGESGTVLSSPKSSSAYSTPSPVPSAIGSSRRPDLAQLSTVTGTVSARDAAGHGVPPLQRDSHDDNNAPALDMHIIRVGPDSPSKAQHTATFFPKISTSRRRVSGSVHLAGGFSVIPPPVEGPMSAQILAQARGGVDNSSSSSVGIGSFGSAGTVSGSGIHAASTSVGIATGRGGGFLQTIASARSMVSGVEKPSTTSVTGAHVPALVTSRDMGEIMRPGTADSAMKAQYSAHSVSAGLTRTGATPQQGKRATSSGPPSR